MTKVRADFYNKRSGERTYALLNIPGYYDVDEYIQDYIYKQVKSWTSDEFFDDCYTSDITYSWSYVWSYT